MSQLMTKPAVSTIDSREVAEMIEKRHSDLLRDIEVYIYYINQYAKLRSDDFFIESTYIAGTGKTYKCYELTKLGCEMVGNKMTGLKGTQFTAIYVQRFNELEQNEQQVKIHFHVPKTFAEALRLAADTAEENEKLKLENGYQAQLIEDYEPKVSYLNEILNSTGTLNITQIAADYDLTAQELNNILHEEKIQKKSGKQWILCKKYLGQGYVKSDTFAFANTNGKSGVNLHTKWTQKGRMLIHEVLKERTIYAILDK